MSLEPAYSPCCHTTTDADIFYCLVKNVWLSCLSITVCIVSLSVCGRSGASRFIMDPLALIQQQSLVSLTFISCFVINVLEHRTKKNLLHCNRKSLVSFRVIIGGVFVKSWGLSSMPPYIDLKCAHWAHCHFPLLLDFGCVFRVQPDCAAVCQHDLQQGYQGEDAGHFFICTLLGWNQGCGQGRSRGWLLWC